MGHIKNIVSDILTQIKLSARLKTAQGTKFKPYIGVYVARHNLIPVTNQLCASAKLTLGITSDSLKEFESALMKHYGIDFLLVVKPTPYEDRNHLTLTIGGLTSIIFDYEN